jgi:hypothetical protein
VTAVSAPLLLRARFALDDRTFTVLGEPWYDAEAKVWRARLLYLPIDRSLPRGVIGVPLQRAPGRDGLLRRLRSISDADLARALRGVALPLPHRLRAGARWR